MASLASAATEAIGSHGADRAADDAMGSATLDLRPLWRDARQAWSGIVAKTMDVPLTLDQAPVGKSLSKMGSEQWTVCPGLSKMGSEQWTVCLDRGAAASSGDQRARRRGAEDVTRGQGGEGRRT